jgi:type IV pilus assembly protein PilW
MAGLSLVELMIALLLGVILTLGVTQIYLGTSQTYRLTESVAHSQENIRFATSMVERDVRVAGGLGCLQDPSSIEVEVNGVQSVSLNDGLTGWEYAGTGVGDAHVANDAVAPNAGNWSEGSAAAVFPPELVGEVVAGTDIVIVNSLQTVNANTTGPNAGGGNITLAGPHNIEQGTIILAIDDDCAAGELFQSGNNPNATTFTMAGNGFDPGNAPASSFDLNYAPADPLNPVARTAAFNTVAFYIGIGAGGEPALFSQRLGAGAVPPRELIDGVESMQMLYGLSNGTIATPTNYVTAANVPAWDQVVSVRMSFLMRSGDNVTDQAAARQFNMLGTAVTSQNDRRSRLLATKTIGLRNRLE